VVANSFIFPAMGSHAGATTDGQREMLIGMGIIEDYVGAPIRPSMDVVQLGTFTNGLPVFMDRNAYRADAIIIINRIKPHVNLICGIGVIEKLIMKPAEYKS